MSKTAQWRNTPEGASGSSTTRTRLLVPSGTPDHVRGGEISAPSQVYCDVISPPGGMAGLASIRGIAVSSNLPVRHPIDKQEHFPPERQAMSEMRFTSGMLVFPNLMQLDLTGSYEVLARLLGALARAEPRPRDRAERAARAAASLR